MAGALMTGPLTPSASAQGSTPVAGGDVEFLFVQSFGSGTIAPGEDGAYTLTLEGGLGQTIYFSDRPNRDVGTVPTTEFLTVFDQMADDPPNAALVATSTEGEVVLVVELTGASLDEATGTLIYDVVLLGEEDVDMRFEQAVAAAPTEAFTLETCHLFIDDLDSLGDGLDSILGPITAPITDPQ